LNVHRDPSSLTGPFARAEASAPTPSVHSSARAETTRGYRGRVIAMIYSDISGGHHDRVLFVVISTANNTQ
jgi:hypothetical protein